MIALAIDENFDHHVLRALVRRIPTLDFRTVQEAGLAGADDPAVLEWAARERRVLLTHDVRTITKFAYERVERGETDDADLGLWCGPNFVNLKKGPQELGAYPYDTILSKLKAELDRVIVEKKQTASA